MPVVKFMDSVMVDSVLNAQDGTQTVTATSVGDGSKRIIKGIPKNIDLTGKTHINLKSSTGNEQNIDYISISKIDEQGEFHDSKNLHRNADGKYEVYHNSQPNVPMGFHTTGAKEVLKSLLNDSQQEY